MAGVFWGGDNEEAVLRFEFIVAFDAHVGMMCYVWAVLSWTVLELTVY